MIVPGVVVYIVSISRCPNNKYKTQLVATPSNTTQADFTVIELSSHLIRLTVWILKPLSNSLGALGSFMA